MTNRLDAESPRTLTRGAFWTSAAFYALVALEFLYMGSPFAAYFYSVYGPSLDFLGGSAIASWLVSFFMPHIVAQTTSSVLDSHTIVGFILALVGIVGFGLGAWQIYSAKLRKRETVESGLYRWIRHPQYLGLIVASFGLLLIWPRFLVLFGFVTVVFLYVLLARSEERLCARRFQAYAGYAERTGMFLPRIVEAPFRRVRLPSSRLVRALAWLVLYVIALALAAAAGLAVQSYSIASLYAHYTNTAAYVSVGRMAPSEIAELAAIANKDARVGGAIQRAEKDGTARFLNYVLPTEMFVSEIPQHLPPGAKTGHRVPRNHDRNSYKIVFTLVRPRPGSIPNGPAIVRDAVNKTAVIEAWIDRAEARVVRTFPPPEKPRFGGNPVPVF